MTYEVAGIKNINYTSKKTGLPVSGRELHVLYSDKNVEGTAVDKIFVSSRIETGHIHVGDNINIFYNRYGQVDFIEVK